MPPEEVQGVLGRAFSDFARDIDTAKTHLSRLAEGSVIVGAVRGMRPEDQAALATSMVPGVGDAAGLYADYTDIRENWDQVPWYDKAGMVGAAALGAVPFVPSRSQVNAGAEVAREMTIAYHGSPHDFPPVRELQMPDGARVYQSMDDAIPEGAKMLKEHPLGRFNMSKIGTGEGAQAYGHGLYFAEAEDVARGYRDALTAHMLVDGKLISNMTSDYSERKILESEFDIDKAIDSVKGDISGFKDTPMGKIQRDGASKALTRLEDIKARGAIRGQKGSMYQVEIDASPDEFLDWDLPLSQQSEAIQGLSQGVGNLDPDLTRRIDVMESAIQANPTLEEAYRPRITKLKGEIDPAKSTGEQLYGEMTKQWGQSKASAVIGGKGIKGIRYKDEFSRGKEGGTSNYVVFDENLISIARKYGIAIPAAAAMLARQTGQNPQDLYEDDST